MDHEVLLDAVRTLREDGTDSAAIEAKAAQGGPPSDLDRIICGFANRPEGGLLLLGLDERNDYTPVAPWDLSAAQQAIASVARNAIEPPPSVAISTHEIDGVRIVVAEIGELSRALKPARVRGTGKAYLRSHDGTYEMSDVEAASLVASRGRPGFDREPVAHTSVDGDLDPALVASYRETCRASSASLARLDDDQILLRTGVLTTEGVPTLAGLLALGVYPQQHFPSFVIRASVAPGPSEPPGTRVSDVRNFDGPLPAMLDEATRWVQRNTRTRVRFGADGHGVDEPEYPAEAVRELVGNALIHRDLGPHALSYPISLTLEHNRLIVSNPGGLWGITVDRLGRSGISSARNDVLLGIARNVRTTGGRRVVEGLATGIGTVLTSLSAAGMVEPEFIDQGVRFTVLVPNHALLGADDLNWLSTLTAGRALSDTQRHALVAMRHGVRWTNRTFREQFPRDSTQARADLQALVDAGLAVAEGERRARTYVLSTATSTRVRDRPDVLTFQSADDAAEEPEQAAHVSRHAPNILRALDAGPMSVAALVDRTALTRRQVTYALRALRDDGSVVVHGRRGARTTTYERTSAHPGEDTTRG